MKKQQALFISLLLFYWFISLNHLDTVPQVYEDEPWIASTAWKIVVDGRFGSDMFEGLYGMSEHYYTHLPLYPLILAGTYLLLGLSLWVSRLTIVLMGLLILSLTYSLGQRLFSHQVALLAVLCLLFVRTTGATFIQISGILLWDLARIARYDMLVAVFGLFALLIYDKVRQNPDSRSYAVVGALVACAGLSHIFGNFWLPVILILALWHHQSWRHIAWILLGFAIVWLPYLLYIEQAPADWLAQMNFHTEKLQLAQPTWYVSNLLTEYQRYGPGVNESDWGLWTRPGFWTVGLLLPLALIRLLQIAVREKSRNAPTLLVPLTILPLLLALLITPKASRYLATVIPLVAIAIAWAAIQLWQWTQQQKGGQWLRLALLMLSLAILAEGSRRIYLLPSAANTTTPYGLLTSEMRTYIAADAHVLGLHDYWLGFYDRPYTTWVVPLQKARDESLTSALAAIKPDVIIWDEPIERLFQQRPELDREVTAWLKAERFVVAKTFNDQTYGTIHIFIQEK